MLFGFSVIGPIAHTYIQRLAFKLFFFIRVFGAKRTQPHKPHIPFGHSATDYSFVACAHSVKIVYSLCHNEYKPTIVKLKFKTNLPNNIFVFDYQRFKI